MTHRDADEILPGGHLLGAVAAGEVIQIHRGQAYAEVGDTFEIDGQRFERVD